MIQFDYANLLADLVGAEHGVSRAEIDQNRAAAARAVESFRKKSESGRYGFPHLPFQEKVIDEVRKFAAACKGRFDSICLVGIGGSALGAWALDCALRGPHPVQKEFGRMNPRLVILDNVDPAFLGAALDSMNPKRTLALAITKSGSTAESISTYLVVRAWLHKAVGAKNIARHVAMVTEPESPEGKVSDLLAMARRESCPAFYLPVNVGGRFSVLSPVGLLPAALAGIDIRKLCAGARDMTHLCWKTELDANPALLPALLHWLLLERRSKPIQVAFSYSNLLWGVAFWFRQLWAESLGKNGRGQTPVAALGVTDQHSQVQLYLDGPNDKVFTFWTAGGARAMKIPRAFSDLASAGYLGGQAMGALFDAERRATAAALAQKQRPNCTFTLPRVDAYHVGAFLQLMEFEVAFMGELMGIDAFDQPGVELGKRLTYALMGRKGFDEYQRQFDDYEKLRRRALG
ncbi:MAG: glucose-6-phosphate isomerase [Acidobacteria bacterium]|nr:glucose-6-phosphate isomerase [Acidobacteriota bacterium]